MPETPATAPATATAPAAGATPDGAPQIRSLNTRWLSRGLTIRVLAYTAGCHLFAGFLYLLFEVGSHAGH